MPHAYGYGEKNSAHRIDGEQRGEELDPNRSNELHEAQVDSVRVEHKPLAIGRTITYCRPPDFVGLHPAPIVMRIDRLVSPVSRARLVRAVTVSLGIALPAVAVAQRPLKVYISVDMEGI